MAKAHKIILGKRPEVFSKEVSFLMLDGSEGCMKVDYTYRTRKEFAEFADAIQGRVKAEAEAQVERYKKASETGEALPDVTQSELMQREAQFKADYIMDAVTGWNLDIPFERAAVEQLVDELPAAATAIIGTYRDAITEGRLGNSAR